MSFTAKSENPGVSNFNPENDIPSLQGKVIFVTGGTGGLGAQSAKTLAVHNPAHIYISGRNHKAADRVISDIQLKNANVGVTFVELDLSSLESVKSGISRHFKHDRLDILICNAGIMAQPAALSRDGYEIQFATCHLGHAMLIRQLLPVLQATAEKPNADVRVISLTSLGYAFHPPSGISFAELSAHKTMKRMFLGGWVRYGHAKLANILYATELARRYPQITAVSVHPGTVMTDLVRDQAWYNRWFIYFACWLQGIKLIEPEKGCFNQVWCAAGARKGELKNGSYYLPVGSEAWATLDKTARDAALAKELWEWTDDVLAKF